MAGNEDTTLEKMSDVADSQSSTVKDAVSMFSSFQEYLEADQAIREELRDAVKSLEQTSREILAISQGIHHTVKQEDIQTICKKMMAKFNTAREQITSLAGKIPIGQYYRFHDHWKFALQRLSFLGALLVYLEKDALATREDIALLLGVKLKWQEGFHMDLDDYLIGLLNLASELARFAVNCVTAGNYTRPITISTFVSELDTAFRLLNLKNDFLRRRFDGLKYDVKKIEEVVYDLTIRGLHQASA